jgi:tRNA(Ile)-lysidine synthase
MRRAVALDGDALFVPLARHDKIGLAVSGGPDSLALMLLAAAWAKRKGIALFVYSVDHGLRPEGAGEAAMVKREAEALGLAARVLRWEGRKPAAGVQAAARAARYRLMAEAMRADGVEVLLTAHHLGDQAETVLMRLAHGSGIDGLGAMRAMAVVEGCTIARPLLGVHPDALRDVVAAAGLTPALDPSNSDEIYERVRWRKVMAQLEGAGLSAARLATLARRLDSAAALVEAAADAAYARIVKPHDTQFEIEQAPFAALNPLVAAEILRRALQRVSGDLTPPPLGPVESLAAILSRDEPAKAATLHGCVVTADGGRITIARELPRKQARKAQEKATAH